MRVLFVVFTSAVLFGCPEQGPLVHGPTPSSKLPGADRLPAATVNLPPVPDLTRPTIPLRHPDGSLTVYGLGAAAKDWKGKAVTVRGHVVEVYVCPPEQKAPPCEAPHFWVSDTPEGKPTRTMVVGYDPKDEDTPEPAAGLLIRIEATFDTKNEQGFVSTEGLLRLTSWTKIDEAAGGTTVAAPTSR